MPRAFQGFFYGLNRKPDETLLVYVADYRNAFHEVEKHAWGTDLREGQWMDPSETLSTFKRAKAVDSESMPRALL